MSEHQATRGFSRPSVIGRGIAWLSTWAMRWILILVAAVLLGWVIQQVWVILLPVLLALILTTALQPLAGWLERRVHLGAGVAAIGAVLAALFVAALMLLYIVPSVGSEATQIADGASDGLFEIERWVQQSRLEVTQGQVDTLIGAAQEKLQSSSSSIASGVIGGVNAVTSALIATVVTFVLSFFFLKDGRRFLPWVRDLSGPALGGHLSEVGTRVWVTLGGFVRAQALVGLIDAVLIGVALVVVGVPLALPLAVLTFVAAFAPIIGAVTVGALAVLVALVANGWVAALIILIVVLLVQQLEGNVFLPWLQGRTLHLHAGVVLLTVLLGASLFGVAGAFLGVPLVAVCAVVLRYLNETVADRSKSDDPIPAPVGEAALCGESEVTGPASRR